MAKKKDTINGLQSEQGSTRTRAAALAKLVSLYEELTPDMINETEFNILAYAIDRHLGEGIRVYPVEGELPANAPANAFKIADCRRLLKAPGVLELVRYEVYPDVTGYNLYRGTEAAELLYHLCRDYTVGKEMESNDSNSVGKAVPSGTNSRAQAERLAAFGELSPDELKQVDSFLSALAEYREEADVNAAIVFQVVAVIDSVEAEKQALKVDSSDIGANIPPAKQSVIRRLNSDPASPQERLQRMGDLSAWERRLLTCTFTSLEVVRMSHEPGELADWV